MAIRPIDPNDTAFGKLFWSPEAETEDSLVKSASETHFALGRSAQFSNGVMYTGTWETYTDALCIAVRRCAFALRRQLPVFLNSLENVHWNDGIVEKAFYHELPEPVRDEVDHMTECKHATTVAKILHFVPQTDFLANICTARMTSGGETNAFQQMHDLILKRTIAYVSTEMTVLKSWIPYLNKFGAVVAPSEFTVEILKSDGLTVPCYAIPYPIDFKSPFWKVRSEKPLKGPPRFLHIGKWEPRKNQHNLIGAFLQNYTPYSGATLTIHSSAFWSKAPYPSTPEESMKYWLQNSPAVSKFWNEHSMRDRIKIKWNKVLTREQLASLYEKNDIYVSSGVAEAFDLCALDAKVAGLILLRLGSGGPWGREFYDGNDVYVLGDTVVPVLNNVSTPDMEIPAGYSQNYAPKGNFWKKYSANIIRYGLTEAENKARNRSDDLKDERSSLEPYKLDSVGMALKKVVLDLIGDKDANSIGKKDLLPTSQEGQNPSGPSD